MMSWFGVLWCVNVSLSDAPVLFPLRFPAQSVPVIISPPHLSACGLSAVCFSEESVVKCHACVCVCVCACVCVCVRVCVCVCVCSERTSSDPGVYPAAAPPAGRERSHMGQLFFEYLLVVSLRKKRNEDGYEPHITYQFPRVRPHTHTLKRTHTDAHIHTQMHTHRRAHTLRRTHTDAHIHTQTHTHRRTHSDAHTHTQTHTHRRTHTHSDAHTQTHTLRRTHTYSDAHTQTHTRTHTYSDAHTHTHTQTTTHTHTHTHTHSDAHTQTHTYTLRRTLYCGQPKAHLCNNHAV